MDNFCMSCHNAAGAVDAFKNVSSALKDAHQVVTNGGVPSARNPFGDKLKNMYDGLTRTYVVAVYEQFDTNKTSHHAVRGKKHTGAVRTGVTPPIGHTASTAAAGTFTQYSGAVQGSIKLSATTGLPTAVRQLFGNYTASYGNSGFGPKSPGSRKTIYEANLFTSAFTTLNGTSLGDDSQLHCGDCHSVGQWATGSAKNRDGSATGAPVGAHGSQNEYMLRTANGTDALAAANTATQPTLTYDANGLVNNAASNGTYVCFLCHKQEAYSGEINSYMYSDPLTGAKSGKPHMGTSAGNCVGNKFNSVGKNTYLTRVGIISTQKSVFVIICLTCHGGNTQIFGGIHGNSTSYGDTKNVGYKCYSTNGLDAQTNVHAGAPGVLGGTGTSEARNAQLTVVTRKPYRFAGGTSLKYNGGGTADKWEQKAMTQQHR